MKLTQHCCTSCSFPALVKFQTHLPQKLLRVWTSAANRQQHPNTCQGSRHLPRDRAAPGPGSGPSAGPALGRAGPGGMSDTRVGSPPVPGAGHSRSLQRLLGEGSRSLLLLKGAQRLEGLRQLLHGGHVRSARAGGTGPRSDLPCHGRLQGPSAVPLPLAVPPSSLPALCRRSRGPGSVTAAMNGAGAARGRGYLPSAPPPSWIRPVCPARAPPPGLPRPPERGSGPMLGGACAHGTPGLASRAPLRRNTQGHAGSESSEAAARATGAVANQKEAPPLAACRSWGACFARPLPAEAAALRGRARLRAGPGVPELPRAGSRPWEPPAAPGTAPRGAAVSPHRTDRPSKARAPALCPHVTGAQQVARQPPQRKWRPKALPPLWFYFRLQRDS